MHVLRNEKRLADAIGNGVVDGVVLSTDFSLEGEVISVLANQQLTAKIRFDGRSIWSYQTTDRALRHL